MATNATPEFLYMVDEDLYRLANASSPKLDNARPVKDIQTYDRNGIMMVRANGLGVSLLTLERIEREWEEHKGSYIWKLPANYPMPTGLVLVADTRRLRPGQTPDHYFLCPQSDMPVSEYVALLSKLALKLERLHKL